MDTCGISSLGLELLRLQATISHPNGLPRDHQEGMVIAAIQTIMPRGKGVLPEEPVFVQSGRHIGRRVNGALFADSVDISFSRTGTAQNLTATGVEVSALMQASRWKSSRIPA